MPIPLTDTLLTGSRAGGGLRCRRKHCAGLTFVEVMLTAVILSVGLVALYRSFFIAADVVRHLTNRLYAINLLENRITLIERNFRSLKDFDIGPMTEEVLVDNNPVRFQYQVQLRPVGNLLTVFQLDLTLSWEERGRARNIARSAYFSGVTSLEKGGAK
ncbi:MAG: hypothetical protein HGA80_01910 [Candidatus Omnitrophica bacterium]|nr:hypothetical protein [Candidatus Omnitrophota bacterium]